MFPMLRVILAASILASAAPGVQTVEGHVVNAVTGAGIPAVKVVVFAFPGGPADGYSTTTDAQGRFRIEGMEEGAYSARYTAPGFNPIPEPGDRLPPFPVAGAEPVRLEVKMQPLGKLSGRVLDATGKPVPNAGLWLVGEGRWCMPPACYPRKIIAKTNEKGEYAVADLVPGPWLVSAAAPASWNPPEVRDDRRLGWAQTFYPGVTDPQLAEAVMVQPGGEIWDLDIELAAIPVHGIRGRLLDVSGKPVPKASVALGKGFGPDFTQETGSDGAFQFEAVVDDEWRLSAIVAQGGVELRSAQSIDLKNRDLENVELRLAAPFRIHGKIIVDVPDGVPVPELPLVDLMLVSGTRLLSDAGISGVPMVANQGNLMVRHDVYPGLYQIETLTEAPAPYYLDSMRIGDQDASGWFSILSDAQPLTITYKLGGGTVRGSVEGCAGGHVLLIPQNAARRRHAFMYFADCGQNGRFEFPAVRPGEYYGFAMAGQPFAATLQDGSLLKKASKVTVEANQSTAADIRLITR